METDRIITRNSPDQPTFFTWPDPGWVGLRWAGKEWMISAAKAEELKAELDQALEEARRRWHREEDETEAEDEVG